MKNGSTETEQRLGSGIGAEGNVSGDASQEKRIEKLQTEMLFLKKTLNELQTYKTVSESTSLTVP